ncbi:MAG: putative DNA binding domain-containing protein [Alphaproteobacteria bacterium]|nr:putative DNA binding domain-containing protein [Alphaproteobacteria bacterium]
MREDKNTEFKREFTDEIKKTVVAFANTDGGTVYIGIEDDGVVSGVADVDEMFVKITNAIRDSIRPDAIALTELKTEERGGKQIVRLNVQRGTARPYYLAAKGLRPEGVYIRHGASSLPASESVIRDMIKENAVSFESERSLNQLLTFERTDAYFQKKNKAFAEEQKKTLELIGRDGTYTVLALLLSDQCPYSIKIARFQGTEKNVFRDRREITGSVLAQMENAFEYLNNFNGLKAEFSGLERIDTFDYPQEALRETLLNCIVHRDYAFSGPVLIGLFDDRMEFVSLGGLVKRLKKEDIFLGISLPRNPNLANVFYRLNLIEAYGTGILKIKEAYRQSNVSPIFEITDNVFKITLPNIHFKSVRENDRSVCLNKTELSALHLFEKQKELNRKEVESALRVSQATAGNALRKLEQARLIDRIGNGKNTVYRKKE